MYEEVENDIFTHFTKALDDEKIVSYEDFYSFIVDYLLEDKNMGKMVLQSMNQNGRLFIKLRDFFVQGCFKAWKHDGRTKRITEELALVAHYRVSGIIGLLLQWISNDYNLNPEEIKRMISKLDESVDTGASTLGIVKELSNASL